MPELPEVETVVRGLQKTVVGRRLIRVRLNAPKASVVVSPTLAPLTLEQALPGRTIERVTRRGKNILIQLSDELTLWAHLKMTGHFTWMKKDEPVGKHDLAIFDFAPLPGESNEYHLRFNDFRRFGRLRLFPNDELWQQPQLARLGPEPLDMTEDEFIDSCHTRPRQIKMALMDQNFIAGIGNIYADEALYFARIHPRRLTSSISSKKLRDLHGHIQRLLRRAIRLRGTSVSSYSGVNGQTGSFQKYLSAYGNEGKPCAHCGTLLIRERIGSRSAHFCPRCQRPR